MRSPNPTPAPGLRARQRSLLRRFLRDPKPPNLHAPCADSRVGAANPVHQIRQLVSRTSEAAPTIRGLIAKRAHSSEAGTRIANDIVAGTLKLNVTELPGDYDVGVEHSGARLFLDPAAAQLVGDQTLDLETNPQGRLQFAASARQK